MPEEPEILDLPWCFVYLTSSSYKFDAAYSRKLQLPALAILKDFGSQKSPGQIESARAPSAHLTVEDKLFGLNHCEPNLSAQTVGQQNGLSRRL